MRRCTHAGCKKLAKNNSLCKFHNCRCNIKYDASMVFNGCLIHKTNYNNPIQKDSLKLFRGKK